MSADFINGIGGRSPHLRETPQSGARALPPTGAPPVSDTDQGSQAAPREAFSPSLEANESPQEQQAGAARASAIFSAWGGNPAPSASAGQLSIQGAENTAIHQVHSVNNGQHVGSQGPEPGISGGTVYSSRPPQT